MRILMDAYILWLIYIFIAVFMLKMLEALYSKTVFQSFSLKHSISFQPILEYANYVACKMWNPAIKTS